MTRDRDDRPTRPGETNPPRSALLGGLRSNVLSLVILLAGLWLFVGAWILDYPFTAPAVDAHLVEMIVGVVVFLVAFFRLLRPRGRLSDAVVMTAGAFLVAAPFLFGYGDTDQADTARGNDVATGIVLFLLGLASLVLARKGTRS